MSRPDALVVLDVLSLSAGAILSILLLVLARGSALRWPGTGLLVKSSLLWNMGGLAALTQMMMGVPTTAWTHIAAVCMQAAGGALFPVSFIAAWSFGETKWRWLRGAAIVNAFAVMALVLARAAFGAMPHLARLCIPCSTAILLTVASIALVRGRLKTASDRIYLTLTLLGTWLSSAGMFALEFADLSGAPFRLTCLVTTEAPLLIIVGALFFFARFRSADVLIKTGLRVVGALALAFAGYGALAAGYDAAGRVFLPAAVGRAVLITLSLFALLMLARWLDGWLTQAAERWILREPDYDSALRDLWDQMSAHDSQAEIFAAAERALPPFLDVAAARVIECRPQQRNVGARPWEVGPADASWAAIPGCCVDLLVPVRVRGEVPHAIAVAPGSCRRILLTKDLHFLQEVAGQISARLESLAGERERVERQSREASLKHLAAVAELKALRAQINPHFLFNSLNTIADLIVADPPKAETMTVLLASVFRHVLLHSDRHLTAISEEVDFLRTYLRIEEVRFGDRLRVNLDIESSVAENRIPSLLLQPIVENAIKHGLAPKIGQGSLRIAARAQGEFTRIEVEDDGVGLGDHRRAGGVGLKNVADRLRMLYDGRAKLTCENAALAGTLVTILIPNNTLA